MVRKSYFKASLKATASMALIFNLSGCFGVNSLNTMQQYIQDQLAIKNLTSGTTTSGTTANASNSSSSTGTANGSSTSGSSNGSSSSSSSGTSANGSSGSSSSSNGTGANGSSGSDANASNSTNTIFFANLGTQPFDLYTIKREWANDNIWASDKIKDTATVAKENQLPQWSDANTRWENKDGTLFSQVPNDKKMQVQVTAGRAVQVGQKELADKLDLAGKGGVLVSSKGQFNANIVTINEAFLDVQNIAVASTVTLTKGVVDVSRGVTLAIKSKPFDALSGTSGKGELLIDKGGLLTINDILTSNKVTQIDGSVEGVGGTFQMQSDTPPTRGTYTQQGGSIQAFENGTTGITFGTLTFWGPFDQKDTATLKVFLTNKALTPPVTNTYQSSQFIFKDTATILGNIEVTFDKDADTAAKVGDEWEIIIAEKGFVDPVDFVKLKGKISYAISKAPTGFDLDIYQKAGTGTKVSLLLKAITKSIPKASARIVQKQENIVTMIDTLFHDSISIQSKELSYNPTFKMMDSTQFLNHSLYYKGNHLSLTRFENAELSGVSNQFSYFMYWDRLHLSPTLGIGHIQSKTNFLPNSTWSFAGINLGYNFNSVYAGGFTKFVQSNIQMISDSSSWHEWGMVVRFRNEWFKSSFVVTKTENSTKAGIELNLSF